MKVEVIVVFALALLYLKAESDVEGFFSRTTDPEIAVRLLVHPDQALLENPGFHHEVMDLDQALGIQAKLVARLAFRRRRARLLFGVTRCDFQKDLPEVLSGTRP